MKKLTVTQAEEEHKFYAMLGLAIDVFKGQ